MSIFKHLLNFIKTLPKRMLSPKFLLKCVVYGPLIVICAFLAFWLYLSTESIPNLVGIDEAAKYSYDYIIVGGGTAGCILASRLSENPEISVLLIEAGGTFSPFSKIPFLTSQQQRTQNDWNLESTSQKYSSFGFVNQVQYLPRGKGIGGSSQLNYLLHFDGHRKDFDRWVESGADLWTINDEEDLSNVVDSKKGCTTEHSCSITDKAAADVKSQNLLRTRLHTTPITYDYSPLVSTFIDASTELYRQNLSSYNYYLAKYNTHKGLRHSVYHAYLKPAFYQRENLKILLSTRVHRIILKQKNAIGVWVTEDNFQRAPQKIHAAREIIISAGAFHTPQILKLSGIGPSKELKRFDIKVLHNSPMIGRNLYDHLSMPLYVSISEPISVTRSNVLNLWEVINYFLHGTGLFSNFGVFGYLNDRQGEFGTGIFGVGSIDERLLRRIVNTDRDVFRQNFPFYNDSKQDGFVLLNTCYQPLSRGTIRLTSNRIHDPPEIDLNYLESQADVDCIIRAIRMAMRLIATASFKAVNAKIHWPQFGQCRNFLSNDDIDITDRYLECIIRVAALTAHHPGGSCAIGKSSNSALDNQMRVRGIRRLRVIDASSIPTPVSGTPHAAITAIAEWASHMILHST